MGAGRSDSNMRSMEDFKDLAGSQGYKLQSEG